MDVVTDFYKLCAQKIDKRNIQFGLNMSIVVCIILI